jgi:hypothetical protein
MVRKLVGMLVALAAFATAPATSAAPILGPGQALSGAKVDSAFHRVDRYDDNLVAVWNQTERAGASTGILFGVKPYRRYSLNGGETWSTIDPLTGFAGAELVLDVAVGPAGVFAAVLRNDGAKLNHYVLKSTDGGKSFGPPLLIGAGANWRQQRVGPTSLARLAVHGNLVWVAYTGDDGNLYVRRSVNGGTTFEAAVPVENSTSVKSLTVSLANDGRNLYIATEADNFGYLIHFYRSMDGGKTFGEPTQFDTPRGRPFAPPEVAAFGFRVGVLWRHLPSARLLFAFSADRGATFRKPLVLKADPDAGYALDATRGRIDVLWQAAQTVPAGTGTEPTLWLSTLRNRRAAFDRRVLIADNRLISYPPVLTATPGETLLTWARRGRFLEVWARTASFPQ